MAMAAKKPPSKISSPATAPVGSRKIEEVDFYQYLKTKKERRYIEEVGIAAYLKTKRRPNAP
jgi:hypothetical protein